jgi:hypothetical protein
MAIFSRRTIQRILDENSSFLTKEQLDQHVTRLNSNGFKPIDAEWEVAVLNAFSKVGGVEHEPSLYGPAKLDLLFTTDGESQFLADITSVSDEGFEEKSPVKAFYVELQERLRRAGLLYHGWTLSIGTHPAKYGEPTIPAIPPRNEFAKEIFNANFKMFLRSIKERPQDKLAYSVRTSKTAITLTYDPQRAYFTTVGPVYNSVQKKNQNPVFNALRLKAKQLKKVDYAGSKGIILCDGGTDMVHTRAHSDFDFAFNAQDATKDFLRQNQSIDFVLLITSVWTEDGYRRSLEGPVRRVKATLLKNKEFLRVPAAIQKYLEEIESVFPEPENTPSGARETIRHGFKPTEFRPLSGGWTVSNQEIKVSANAVYALLAGVISPAQFSETLGFGKRMNESSAVQTPFTYMLERKMRIKEILVEDTAHDDSKLIFKFDGPDSALSPFVNPKRS